MGRNVLPVGCSVLLVVRSVGCNVLPVVCSMGCNVLPVGYRGRGGPRWACRIPHEWPLWPWRASSAADRTFLASATWHGGSGTTPAGTHKSTRHVLRLIQKEHVKRWFWKHLQAHTKAHDMYSGLFRKNMSNDGSKTTPASARHVHWLVLKEHKKYSSGTTHAGTQAHDMYTGFFP